MSTGFRTAIRSRNLEAHHSAGAYRREAKGVTDTQTRWTDKQPHPVNMSRYDELLQDSEASIGRDVLTDIIAGVGYYTEMPEDVDAKHKNKKEVDEYGERINLDEKLKAITSVMLGKGFCPVERLSDFDLKLLPPEGFYIWKDKKGKLLKYTQEVSSATVATWEGKSMEDVILFINNEDPSHPYGRSMVDAVADLIDARKQMNEDMPDVIHRYAYPMIVWETSKTDMTNLMDQVTDREKDEDIFIPNVNPDEVRWQAVEVNPQARFMSYIELIYWQIGENFHAPMLLLLKNATEASANVMMESVDRFINGKQRYIKRRVERFLFEPQCGEPVPRLVWGQPKTGLEETTLSDIATVLPFMDHNQQYVTLKQFLPDLPERQEEPQVQLPFQKPPMPMPPLEQVLEKLNDLGTQLNVIEVNLRERCISKVKAMRMGGKAIDVHCKRLYPKSPELFAKMREEEYEKWVYRIWDVKKEKGKVYKVLAPSD